MSFLVSLDHISRAHIINHLRESFANVVWFLFLFFRRKNFNELLTYVGRPPNRPNHGKFAHVHVILRAFKLSNVLLQVFLKLCQLANHELNAVAYLVFGG